MNIIEIIYDLINQDNSINTFKNNKELFQSFFYSRPSIYYNGVKVIDIYRYILSLKLDEYDENFPYFNSKIYYDFNNYIIHMTQGVYRGGFRADDDYVERLFNLIDTYYEFQSLGIKGDLYNLVSESSFIRDCTGAMIIILNSSFFNISNDNINKISEYVKDNKYLMAVINSGTFGKGLMDRNYLFQYSSRFLFNVALGNEENIENDYLLKALKDGKIKDYDTWYKIIKDTNICFLDYCFPNGFTSFVDMLDQTFSDDYDKVRLFNHFLNKLIEADAYRYILKFFVNDSRADKLILEGTKKGLMEDIANYYVFALKKDEIEYLLEYVDNDFFLINLKENLKSGMFDQETSEYVEELTKDVDSLDIEFNEAIKILDSLFKEENIIVDVYQVFAALKSVIRYFLNDDAVNVYLMKRGNELGMANDEINTIYLNYDYIYNLANGHNFDQEVSCLRILETLFHECTHILQFKGMRDGDMSDELYLLYKEEILREISIGYYSNNYYDISFEQDARVKGTGELANFLETFFPYMQNAIESFRNKSMIEKKQEFKVKVLFELSDKLSVDEILEKIISINPGILEQYPLLNREYNKDGSRKNKPVLI